MPQMDGIVLTVNTTILMEMESCFLIPLRQTAKALMKMVHG